MSNMKQLSLNWITEGLIDVEYKTYLLLGYLSEVKKDFHEEKLYPALGDLFQHYKNLLEVKQNRENLRNAFPKSLIGADFSQSKLEFKENIPEDEFLKVLDELVNYSLPEIQNCLESGKTLYEQISKELFVSEIGIRSVTIDNGYFFLTAPPKKNAHIYKYNLTKIYLPDGPYRAIHVSYLDQVPLGISNTFEKIKTDLIRSSTNKGALATFLIESNRAVPWDESLLPVAKRKLIEHLINEQKLRNSNKS